MSGSIVIYGTYIAFAFAAIIIFALRPPQQAVLLASFLGWLLLPVAAYPPEVTSSNEFPMDIIGTSLPSQLGPNKTLVVAVVVFLCLVIRAPGLFRRVRVTLPDVALGLFCLSPLLAGAAGRVPFDHSLAQVVYLMGVWGCTWMTGRMVLAGSDGQAKFVATVAQSGLLLLLPAILEGLRPAWIYLSIYGPHPFAFSGVSRYFGFRPLAFFEDGNQYGMWACMAALAGVYQVIEGGKRSPAYIAQACLLAAIAVASQSVGAIFLFIGGCIWMLISAKVRGILVAVAAFAVVTGGAAYLSGQVPLRSWARETASGQAVSAVLGAADRGSLGWRVQRDQKALQLIHSAPVTGYGIWDWWRPVGSHPWGLPLLIAGQFGALSLVLAAIAMLAGPLREICRGSRSILPVIVLLALIDSWLNSAAYFPALFASAAIAVPLRRRSTQAVREHSAPMPTNATEEPYA